jgi:amylosucrase
VLGFQRPGEAGAGPGNAGPASTVLVLANFGDGARQLPAVTFSGFGATAVELLSGATVSLADGIALAPHQYLWLRVTPA